jgi:hypothetical protein
MTMQERPHPEHKQWIGLREFLRGGYHDITGPVEVRNRKKIIAIWTPVPKDPPKEKG